MFLFLKHDHVFMAFDGATPGIKKTDLMLFQIGLWLNSVGVYTNYDHTLFMRI